MGVMPLRRWTAGILLGTTTPPVETRVEIQQDKYKL